MPSVVVVLLAIGCQPAQPTPKVESSHNPNKTVSPATASDPKELAVTAKDALFKKLSTRLSEAMGTGGPAAAIEVCSREAPRIADQIGKEYGVMIGRTSFKLRNSRNTPPEWVRPLIENRPTHPQFVELSDKHTGALLPIMLKVQCLACHGPKVQIAEDVRGQLAKLYPDDQAVGFNEGDLRGWFWVDVPDQTASANSSGASAPNGNPEGKKARQQTEGR